MLLSQDMEENDYLDNREIKSVVEKYFNIESCHCGGIYFNLLPLDCDKLERKIKNTENSGRLEKESCQF